MRVPELAAGERYLGRGATHDAYELRVGRWSRRVGVGFLDWLHLPSGLRWLDVGAGTGALSAAIATRCAPTGLVALDPSLGSLLYGHRRDAIGAAAPIVGDARALPFREAVFDVVVSGLALNFLPDPPRSLDAMARLTRPGGVVAAYVWDFGGEMQPHRRFWDAAIALDPAATRFDQATKFPLCRLDALEVAFVAAGLREVETRQIDVTAEFRDLDDLWLPFVTGDGSVVEYARSLTEAHLLELRERLRRSLEIAEDGRIRLIARALAARGRHVS